MALGWGGPRDAALPARLAASIVVAVGRMALTNYLLQTVICTTIFYGHGFGLFGRVDRAGQLAIVRGNLGIPVAGVLRVAQLLCRGSGRMADPLARVQTPAQPPALVAGGGVGSAEEQQS